MKRTAAFLTVIALAFALAGCMGQYNARRKISRLVKDNYNAIAAACESGDTEVLLAMDGIEKVDIADGYILVYCGGTGIAPSSLYYGFYYSAENLPIAVNCNLEILCASDQLQPEGTGYQYTLHGNVFYTEHIQGNLYFYSAAY